MRGQYERFPYPPVPRFALPHPSQGKALRYDFIDSRSTEDIRVLVAGAGTVEPLVVAQMHPDARSLTAIELSEHSAAQLKTRIRMQRVLRFYRRLPQVEVIRADLWKWQPQEAAPFDYIVTTNVLHHTEDPGALLVRLSSWLKKGGRLRLVTYPKGSRLWMRHTARFLKERGLKATTPDLVRLASEAVRELPKESPLRSCFESCADRFEPAGIVDAFFHECENPLSPLEWREAARCAGLTLRAEAHDESSRSSFLDELAPALSNLDSWTKLQILDDLLEVCDNFVFWFEKTGESTRPPEKPARTSYPSWQAELGDQLRHVQQLLASSPLSLEQFVDILRREVGPRGTDEYELPGLTVGEHDLAQLLSTPAV